MFIEMLLVIINELGLSCLILVCVVLIFLEKSFQFYILKIEIILTELIKYNFSIMDHISVFEELIVYGLVFILWLVAVILISEMILYVSENTNTYRRRHIQ